MATQYQFLPDELQHCKPVDQYWDIAIRDSPTPGRMIYTDGKGRLFELMPDGSINDL